MVSSKVSACTKSTYRQGTWGIPAARTDGVEDGQASVNSSHGISVCLPAQLSEQGPGFDYIKEDNGVKASYHHIPINTVGISVIAQDRDHRVLAPFSTRMCSFLPPLVPRRAVPCRLHFWIASQEGWGLGPWTNSFLQVSVHSITNSILTFQPLQ